MLPKEGPSWLRPKVGPPRPSGMLPKEGPSPVLQLRNARQVQVVAAGARERQRLVDVHSHQLVRQGLGQGHRGALPAGRFMWDVM